jgi:hypothetical protein
MLAPVAYGLPVTAALNTKPLALPAIEVKDGQPPAGSVAL